MLVMGFSNTKNQKNVRQTELLLRKKLEEELKRVRFAIWDIDKLYRLELLQHELKTPLTTLTLLMEKMQYSTKTTKQDIKFAQDTLHHMKTVLVTQQVANETFDLIDTINECMKISRIERYAIDIIRLRTLPMYGNSCKFRQILINILNNAKEAAITNTDIVHVSIRRRKDWSELEIKNEVTTQTCLLNKSNHIIATSLKTEAENRGLGFALCRKIAEQDFSGTVRLRVLPNNTISVILRFPRK